MGLVVTPPSRRGGNRARVPSVTRAWEAGPMPTASPRAHRAIRPEPGSALLPPRGRRSRTGRRARRHEESGIHGPRVRPVEAVSVSGSRK